MWGLFELLRFSFSSIIWGILITAICLALFFFLIRGWYRNATFTPISYVIGFFLFLLLAFQCTMIVGAIKIINISPYYESQIQQLVGTYFPPSQEITGQESEQVIDWLVTEYPILQHYFDTGEFTGYTAQQLPGIPYPPALLRHRRVHRLYRPAAPYGNGCRNPFVPALLHPAPFVVVLGLCDCGGGTGDKEHFEKE